MSSERPQYRKEIKGESSNAPTKKPSTEVCLYKYPQRREIKVGRTSDAELTFIAEIVLSKN